LTGVPEAAETIEAAASIKPLVAYSGGMMASAAYWLSVSADAIIVAPSADIGSIGVYTAMLDTSRQLENEGIKVELFKQGKFKAMGLPGLPLTDEQREHIQKGVDDAANWFKGYVWQSRAAIPAEAMEGQTYMGRDDVAVGLADEVGTLARAIEYARNEATRRRE
jgi:ClpP class serine protease